MSLRESIEALLSTDPSDDAARRRQVFLEILAATDESGPEEVTARLGERAARYEQECNGLLGALRRKLTGEER